MISRAMVSARRTSWSAIVLGVLACGLALAFSAGSAMGAECPNEQLRKESVVDPTTGQPFSTELPDCRAYEMVSPLDKQAHGAGVGVSSNGPNVLPIALSPDGTAAGWSSEGDFADPENFGVTRESALNGYLSRRGVSGWSVESAFAPRNFVDGPAENGGGLEGDLSPDLFSLHVSCGTSPIGKGERGGKGQSYVCAFRKQDGQWESTPLFRSASGTTPGSEVYLGASSDLSRVFLQPEAPLQLERGEDTGLEGNSVGIYEIAGVGTSSPYLRLVNVDNTGTELLARQGEGGEARVGPLIGAARHSPHVKGSDLHAISESGAVFFTAKPLEGNPVLTIYGRLHCVAGSSVSCKEDGNNEFLETVPISNPSPSQCTEESCPKACTALEETELEEPENPEEHCLRPATFEGASADGSKVFFTTAQRLLNGDTDGTADLYEYDFKSPPGKNLIQISTHDSAHEPPKAVREVECPRELVTPSAGCGAHVQGVVRTSSDGSHVYFVATGVLTTEKNANDEEAVNGHSNLYGYDTVNGKTQFVASTAEPKSSFDVEEPETFGTENKIEETDLDRNAQTTPNGRVLVFTSPAKLAKDTNKAGVPAVYRYDFQTGDLTWISHPAPSCSGPDCAPAPGGRESGAYVAARPGTAPTYMGAYADVEDWSRAISGLKVGESNEEYIDENDGEYIIFTTPEVLQKNDVAEGQNVYAWHCSSPCQNPAGEGEQPGEGTVHMISDGHDSEHGVAFNQGATEAGATISATGSDVFFTTGTRLVGQDTDVMRDIYDARIGGGFPAPAAEPSCGGEACQGNPPEPRSFEASTSSQFPAAGNLLPGAGGTLAFHTTTPRPLTRAQKLAKALKACKGKPKRKRAACESQARKKYGSKAKPKKKAKAKKRGGK